MSSTILHANSQTVTHDAATAPHGTADDKNPFLVGLGKRVAGLRARRGMTRKALANSSAVSERHLANLELGVGNASIVVLSQVARALDCPLTDLISDEGQSSPEKMLIQALLNGKPESDLTRARLMLYEFFGEAGNQAARHRRIALIGLRGAGKSSLGRQLAEELGVPFVELTREIERVAGCSLAEIQSLLGQAAYRRYEKRALEEVVLNFPDAVIATPGGIVSDPATFKLLLSECLTVWLKASPAEHMQRVLTQGDMRPMAGNREAMDDLKNILAGRAAFYSKAELRLDTSAAALQPTFLALRMMVRGALGISA